MELIDLSLEDIVGMDMPVDVRPAGAGLTLKTWGPNTLNNYTPADIEWFTDVLEPMTTNMVAAREKGASGTPHIQFTCTFRTNMRLNALKKLDPRIHWTPTRNTAKAYEYCTKEGDVFIVAKDVSGERGKRNDLKAVYEMARSNMSRFEFLETEPNYQQIKVFDCYRAERVEPPLQIAREVIWLYGETGSGKTRWAYDNYPLLYRKSTYKWWDGYKGQETVLIDEFRAGWCTFAALLELIDRYGYRGEVKGGHVCVTAVRFIFTSNISPLDMFDGIAKVEDLKQLARRLGYLGGVPGPRLPECQ